MSGKVTLSSAPADPGLGTAARAPTQEVRAALASQAAEGASRPDLRLIIEEAPEPGHYIYTLVDRRTGKIVSRLPREEVLRMREQPTYAAGAVFDGTA